jgi:hypothetical protein
VWHCCIIGVLQRYFKIMPPSSKDRPWVEDAAYKLADLVEECDAKESVQDNLLRVMEVGDAVEGLEENLVRPDRRFIYEAPLKIIGSVCLIETVLSLSRSTPH